MFVPAIVCCVLVAMAAPPSAPFEPPPAAAMDNVRRLSPRILSGSEPTTAAAFEWLKSQGVTTIVSVDGVRPRLQLARQHGLRYVHIPFGYDAIPPHAANSLTAVVRETDGPVYIHCHHGRHRGPAAAAIACMAAGTADVDAAVQILESSGTSPQYSGLWRDVKTFIVPDDDAVLPVLTEAADVPSMAASMATLSRSFDNLKLCRAANWKTPRQHADLVPIHEALLLHEVLHEASRHDSHDFDARFRTWLQQSEQHAKHVYEALQNDVTKAKAHFAALERSCKQCHQKYRDGG